jgi:hypothetical protein
MPSIASAAALVMFVLVIYFSMFLCFGMVIAHRTRWSGLADVLVPDIAGQRHHKHCLHAIPLQLGGYVSLVMEAMIVCNQPRRKISKTACDEVAGRFMQQVR